jgi:hypothetical protein
MTAVPLTDQQLRDRLAEVIRNAAYDCDGTCGLGERECDAQHPIQVAVLHFGIVSDVTGDVHALADTVAAVVQPELDRLRAELTAMTDLRDRAIAKQDRLRADLEQAQADVERIRTRENGVRAVRRQALREVAAAEDRIAAVLAVCDQAEKGATRWEQPLPVPEWVAVVRAAAQPPADAPGCGCQTYVHPGHYPSCPTRTAQPSA